MKSWIPVLGLSFAAFIFVTSEFIPVGLLSDIAHGFSKTDAQVGLMMTIYAWVVAVASLPLTAYSTKFNRRHLMLTLLAIFVSAHVLSTVAWSFGVLTASRLLVAVTHAIFWAVATPLGIRLAPPGKRDRAMAILVAGAVLGNLLGIPIGTYLGQVFGWRFSFGAIGLCAAIVGATLLKTMPSLPSQTGSDFRIIARLFRRKNLVLVYVLTGLMMTGHYTAFTFINPYLLHVAHLPKEMVATVLLIFGCSGIVGTFFAPRLMSKHATACALISPAIVGACLFAMYFAVATLTTTMLLVFVWGLAFLFFNLVLQNLVLRLAPDAEDVAMAGYSGIYNIGIGAGALLGSLSSTDHIGAIGFIGAGLIGVAWLVCAYLMKTLPPASAA